MTTSPEAARPTAAMLPAQPVKRGAPTQLRTAVRPLVIVSVGTDHHPFGRLIGWVDSFAARHPEFDVVIQHGSAAPPTHARSVEYLSHGELVQAIDKAAVVVSHGGPATISEAWRAGMIPLVAPRGSRLGEHVDDHQQAFVAVLANRGQVVEVKTQDELDAALVRALGDPGWLRRDDEPEFDLARSVANVSEVVDRVLAQARTRRSARRGTPPQRPER